MEKFIAKILDLDNSAVSANKIRTFSVSELIDIYNKIAEEAAEFRKQEMGINKERITNIILQYIARKNNKKIVAEGLIFRTPRSLTQRTITNQKHTLCLYENHYYPLSDDIVLPSHFIRNNKLFEGQKIHIMTDAEFNPISLIKNYTPMQNTLFHEMVPYYPKKKFTLVGDKGDDIALRMIDLLIPIGYGQRGIIVAPPRAGKTTIFQQLAHSIGRYNKNVHIIILLIDERAEEVTEMKLKLGSLCEVIYSDFSEPVERHIHTAELAIEYAKRIVENNQHVVLFLDSLTRLSRAYNAYLPNNGKILTGGLDTQSLQLAKRFFSNARYIDSERSLTIMSTVLIDTGSKMDNVICEELKGRGNLDMYLSRELAQRGLYPAIDLLASGTRNDHLLQSESERAGVAYLRRMIATMKSDNSNCCIEEIIHHKFKESRNNKEFIEKLVVPGRPKV